MNPLETLNTIDFEKATVKFTSHKKKFEIRLREPSHQGVVEWGKGAGELQALVKNGQMDAGVAQLQNTILCLKHTMVVDESQPAMSDEQLSRLIKASGGIVKSELVIKAVDLMWDAAGFPAKDIEGDLDLAAQANDVPLSLPEPTT